MSLESVAVKCLIVVYVLCTVAADPFTIPSNNTPVMPPLEEMHSQNMETTSSIFYPLILRLKSSPGAVLRLSLSKIQCITFRPGLPLERMVNKYQGHFKQIGVLLNQYFV